MVQFGVQVENGAFTKRLMVVKLGNERSLFQTKLELLKSLLTQRILKFFTLQHINVEEPKLLISVEDQNQHFINQQMAVKLGKKLLLVYLSRIWEELESLFHQLMKIMFMQSLKEDMEKVVCTALRTKVKIGLNKAILIQAETTIKK